MDYLTLLYYTRSYSKSVVSKPRPSRHVCGGGGETPRAGRFAGGPEERSPSFLAASSPSRFPKTLDSTPPVRAIDPETRSLPRDPSFGSPSPCIFGKPTTPTFPGSPSRSRRSARMTSPGTTPTSPPPITSAAPAMIIAAALTPSSKIAPPPPMVPPSASLSTELPGAGGVSSRAPRAPGGVSSRCSRPALPTERGGDGGGEYRPLDPVRWPPSSMVVAKRTLLCILREEE